jgi:hypothetical protein
MKAASGEQLSTVAVLIEGFDHEDIEITVEQLEDRIMPESTAGFLD